MNKINKDWKEVKLGDIGNIITGSTPPTKNKEYFGKDCLFITPTDYRNCNKYISNSERGISILGIEKLKNRLLPSGSIMVTCIATMGKVLINKLPAITNQQINSIIIDNKKFSADFIYYLLIHNNNKIKSIVSGSAVPILNKKDFSNLVFEFPPLAEQKRIASILSALDDKIELDNKTNKILEEMAQTIFKEWFINFNFPNEDGKPYKKSGGEMIDSELGKIPKGWKVITLKDIISIAKGKKPNATSDKITEKFTMPYLTINCYNNEATEYTEYNEKMHVKELDIVMVMDGNAGKIFYGKEGILSSTMAKLIVEDSNLNELVFYFLKSIEYDLMYHTVGSVIQHADKQYMLNKKFCVSLDNLERLSDIFKCIRKEISLNKKENEKLSNIRDSLLPKLMTPKGRRADGEIRV
ncbi:restriction endonuclease subunit S [Brachyspira aalborgi]|jgi:type I restriction enzyme S subunit|uniref:Restriction endonuclease subunit S n=1 Tax=Brachyspira aalborgi TaxID=29522 RepID=A0ABY3K728_9SPIR|nr:restriction endonuclease subunit S [Brachyspira aalborgi]TXJ31272.1 restriction endonuclease subunit S [Brachyspira aalborgi]TXJ40656.1 restriction endonuclease subunit S [Brachyspira aalborgi]